MELTLDEMLAMTKVMDSVPIPARPVIDCVERIDGYGKCGGWWYRCWSGDLWQFDVSRDAAEALGILDIADKLATEGKA